MSLTMQEGVDFEWPRAADPAAMPSQMTVVSAEPYEPDVTAYIPDPANDRMAALREQLKTKKIAPMRLSVTCTDGRRESFDLSEADTKAYLKASVDGRLADREMLVNCRIMERRLKIALEAYGNAKRGRTITPAQDAALREFDGFILRTQLHDGERALREAGSGNAVEYEVLRPNFDRAAREALKILKTGNNTRLREEGFFDGSFDPGDGFYRPWGDREYIARGGPAARQQLISDVWDAQAKNYWAWSHDPVIREGCAILSEFPLGRGVRIIAKDPILQDFIDNQTKRLKLDHFNRVWTNQLSRDGELFVRKIRNGDGTLDLIDDDPQTIWEVVTDAENVGKVFYFVQRFPTRYQLQSSEVPDASVRYVDRTIPANDMVWVKINADSHDVRGRGDPFPALGHAKRLRDLCDAEVQKAQALAAYQWIIKVKGGSADMSRVAAQVPGGRPQSGASWVVNEGVDVTASPSGTHAAAGNGSAYEMLLNQIALAFGFPKDYFGISSRGSRATALVAADPASKRFEDRQNVIKGELIEPIIDSIIDEARRYGLLVAYDPTIPDEEQPNAVKEWGWRASFPAIVKADAQVRATLLEDAKANGAISHKTYSEEVVAEIDLEDYDYDAEMNLIRDEIGCNGWTLSSKNGESVKRGLPDPTDVAFDPGEVPNPGAVGGPSLDADPKTDPAAASPTSATGAAKIRKDVGAHEARKRAAQHLRVQEAARIVSEAGGLVVFA